MKLNPDLIRDILLTLEEKLGYNQYLAFNESTHSNFDKIEKYEYEEILYHIKQCDMSGLIVGARFFLSRSDGCHINDLSPKGHAFLADIRSDTNWNKTKEIAKSAGAFSLDALAKIAVGVVTAAINKHLGP